MCKAYICKGRSPGLMERLFSVSIPTKTGTQRDKPFNLCRKVPLWMSGVGKVKTTKVSFLKQLECGRGQTERSVSTSRRKETIHNQNSFLINCQFQRHSSLHSPVLLLVESTRGLGGSTRIIYFFFFRVRVYFNYPSWDTASLYHCDCSLLLAVLFWTA